MNDQTTPDDPFDGPAPAKTQAEQDNRHNAAALEHLRREIIAQPFNAQERMAELKAMNAQRKTLSPATNIPERLKSDMASAASEAWNELDKLALIRAAGWIVQADGFGVGITATELDALASRNPERIGITARKIVRRLSEIVTAPDADATAVSGSEALAGILPRDLA